MRTFLFFILFHVLACQLLAQESEAVLITNSGKLFGTLSVPENRKKMPVVLIIAGSGPTDRNGNNRIMENNSLKMLADTLFSHGIASLRFDKRGIGQSERGAAGESEIVFEHFVDDANGWVEQLADDRRFNKIIVAGHSEGSLIATVVANRNKKVAGLVSIAGPGRPLDEVLKEQLSGMVPEARGIVYGIIDTLKAGDTIPNIPPLLQNLFRSSVQPFLISLFRYDPAQEFSRIAVPSLIISGGTDVQVKPADGEALLAANPKAKLIVINDMNHVLKKCDYVDKKKQVEEIYNDPQLPLHPVFSRTITEFVGGL